MRTIDELRHDLADRLLVRVVELKLTQAEAATLCGVHQPRISEIKRHHFDNVSANQLIRMLARLGVVLRLQVKVESKTRGIPQLEKTA